MELMRIGIISFTVKGGNLNIKICQGLQSGGMTAVGYGLVKHIQETELNPFHNLHELMNELFKSMDGIIVIGACGIAVRAIAPLIKSKGTDPAVIVIGEDGKYVISLLSGHIGGANELSRNIAGLIGAQPVITTATDINHKFAVDNWAVKNSLIITDLTFIKEISGTILDNNKVGLCSEYPIHGDIPCELTLKASDVGICIAGNTLVNPFPKTLHLLPRNIVLGIGCRKDTKITSIIDAVRNTFRKYNLDEKRICRICSIDLKAKEEGILKLSEYLQAEYSTFTAEELNNAPGDFNASEFVEKTVGVDNVCERSAFLGSSYGKMLIPKTADSGITLSAYEKDYAVTFKFSS
ncbi:cobalamin biosynthesis protein CbiG [Anaerocolumna sedimenticola]|uniref:Cobalamin biosynthesis protein CbiG n=1 Tax=Anaerocolumna sedimenticola TaxID=2696063 RepID=A0A6P1TJ71_9FIRM|nr:cobalt-precorrin 5A hydrolase [Anaerocolumna sedimenticola]QHQ61250.1 cobalamin biosynthesis protein CbiG [Anaerocolumna sedimenticola]